MKNVIFSYNIEYIQIGSLFIKYKNVIFKNFYLFNHEKIYEIFINFFNEHERK